jgi:HSP20 family protein
MADAKIEKRAVRPPALSVEEEGRVLLMLDMPGVTKDNVEIQIEDNELTVVGHRSEAGRQGVWLVKERVDGDYYASYVVDDTIDPQRIEAAMQNGVLTLTLHVKDAVKPRRIAVKAG